MAYFPLYATLEDNSSGSTTAHTHTLRGSVTEVDFWLNSHFGSVMRLSASSKGKLTTKLYNRIAECKDKVKSFSEAGNLKKVGEWEAKLKQAEEEHAEAEKNEKVEVSISIDENPKFKFFVGSVELNKELITAMNRHPELIREFLLKLERLNKVKQLHHKISLANKNRSFKISQ